MVLALILIDALRYDFVTKQTTPFIFSINRGLPLQTILGYSDAARASIYTGCYPDKHGYWTKCCYRPSNSPYKYLKPLSIIDKFPNFYLKRGCKLMISKTLCKFIDYAYNYQGLDIYNIPINQASFFDLTVNGDPTIKSRLRVPTFFDIIKANNIPCRHFNTARSSLKKLFDIRPSIADDEIMVFDIHYLDYAAHRFGINSAIYWQYLAFMDELAKKIVINIRNKTKKEPDFIVFSDHGITESTVNVSFNELIKHESFGKDFVAFLDSTIIHLWYFTPAIKEKIRVLLMQSNIGRFLSEKELRQLGVHFHDRRYGDDIFLIKPPYSIFPNFISLVRPKAMHAYHPYYLHQHGFFGLQSSNNETNSDVEKAKLVDIFPTLLDLIGLSIPNTCEGRSLIRNAG